MEELFYPTTRGQGGDQPSLYACSMCTRRKVRCDKILPSCSACNKSHVECSYGDAITTKKRRRPPSEFQAKAKDKPQRENIQPPDPPKTTSEEFFGKLVLNGRSNKTRYVHSNIWMSLGDELHPSSDEEQEEVVVGVESKIPTAEPALYLSPQTPTTLPSFRQHVAKLWPFYVRNVDPICKLVHVPSASDIVERAASKTGTISKAEKCLLLSTCHIAAMSVPAAECFDLFGCSKEELQAGYYEATRNALARCWLLRTTKFVVLQAHVILLVAIRDKSDAATLWIESGIAMRIAQRMGLHRNAANAAHGPFDEQMRRRVWWQVMIIDKMASQLSGTGAMVTEMAWDSEMPLNINDSDIWPDMTVPPVERKGATDMFFFMSRMEIGRTFITKSPIETFGTRQKSWDQLTSVICGLEDRLESRYVRYCDCSVPFHLMAVSMTRGTLGYCRLRLMILQAQGSGSPADFALGKLSAPQRRSIVECAAAVVDQYIACHSNSSLQRYSWHLNSTLQWDPLIWVLHELCHDDPQLDVYRTWQRVDDMFIYNPQILEQKRILDVAVGRLVLKAWTSTLAREDNTVIDREPPYITQLREAFDRRKAIREASAANAASEETMIYDPMILDELAGEAADWGIDWDFWDEYLHVKDSGF